MKKIAGIIVGVALFGINLSAQTMTDVVNAYNEGAKTIQTDLRAAIGSFEKAIDLAAKVGEPANDLKQKAIGVLPGLYVRLATNTITDKKSSEETIKTAKTARTVAEKYGNATAKENAGKVLVQGYYNLGVGYYTKKDYENAIKSFDSLLAINPSYLNAIYNKALIYRTQNNTPAFEESVNSFIEKSKSANDSVKVKQASKLALEYFRAAGSQANQANKLEEATTLLGKAAGYGEDKDLYYYFADVYNKQKNFASGEEYALKGLALETGAAEAKAKFYFQLGMAQAGAGKTAEACETFKNSMFGVFMEPSKVQRNNLKCK